MSQMQKQKQSHQSDEEVEVVESDNARSVTDKTVAENGYQPYDRYMGHKFLKQQRRVLTIVYYCENCRVWKDMWDGATPCPKPLGDKQ